MILRYVTNNNYYRVGGDTLWQEMEEEKVLVGRSWMSMKEHFLKNIMKHLGSFSFLSEQQRSFLRERTVVKDKEGKVAVGQVRYTKEEKDTILSFIAANQGYGKPGGNKLWKKMEEEKLLESRTWLSMKNHYLKTLKNRKPSSLLKTRVVSDTEEDKEEEMEVDECEEKVDEVEKMEDDGGEVEDGEDEVVPSCILMDF